MSRLKEKVSALVLSQLPEFLRGDDTTSVVLANANVTTGSNVIIISPSSDSIKAGQKITGTNVDTNTYVKEVKSTSKVIASKNLLGTANGSGIAFTTYNDVPRFFKFLEAYYGFLQQDQGSQEVIQNARLYSDVDQTTSNLISNFFATYGNDIPRNIITNKQAFIKHFRDVYKTKGSEEAYKLFFRVMFNTDVDFFYSESVVMKPSDGIWRKNRVVRVKKYDTSSPLDFKNTIVTGNTSGAYATVNEVLNFNINGTDVYELFLDQGSILGTFQSYEQLKTRKLLSKTANTYSNVYGNVLPILTTLDIIDGGLGYTSNSHITITDSTGSDAQAKIAKVNEYGTILEIEMLDYGIDYTNPTITVQNPSKNLTGNLVLTSNVAIVTFTDKHGLSKLDTANLYFTGNSSSLLNNTYSTANVGYVPSNKSIRFTLEANNTSASVTLSYTNSANLRGNVGTLGTSAGYWVNENSILDTKYLRGSALDSSNAAIYYQPFSYVVKSELDAQTWVSSAKEIIHPAGLAVFPEVLIKDTVNANVEVSDVADEIWDYFALTADHDASEPGGSFILTSNTTYTSNSVTTSLVVSNVFVIFRYL